MPVRANEVGETSVRYLSIRVIIAGTLLRTWPTTVRVRPSSSGHRRVAAKTMVSPGGEYTGTLESRDAVKKKKKKRHHGDGTPGLKARTKIIRRRRELQASD